MLLLSWLCRPSICCKATDCTRAITACTCSLLPDFRNLQERPWPASLHWTVSTGHRGECHWEAGLYWGILAQSGKGPTWCIWCTTDRAWCDTSIPPLQRDRGLCGQIQVLLLYYHSYVSESEGAGGTWRWGVWVDQLGGEPPLPPSEIPTSHNTGRVCWYRAGPVLLSSSGCDFCMSGAYFKQLHLCWTCWVRWGGLFMEEHCCRGWNQRVRKVVNHLV